MRTNLMVFRVKHGMTQEAMANKIGYKRSTYSAIERGKRSGRHDFWRCFQNAFCIPDADMWTLQIDDE